MKSFRTIVCALVVCAAHTPALYASPTMIRLGYSDCVTCHVSPQGGGLLTTYGKAVDEAQSLRAREVTPIDTANRRLLYDFRFVAASQMIDALRSPSTPTSASTFRVFMRSSLRVSEHNRMSYALGLESPTLTRSRTGASGPTAANLLVTKALWQYRPRQDVELAVGRDEMPSGIGLPDPLAFIRQGNDAGDTAYPTQAKLFWSPGRLQITPYAFGPGGDEAARFRQYGGGVVAGVDVWKHRAIVGMSARASRASTFRRNSAGAFARLGFGKWGVLAEHDVTSRSQAAAGAPVSYLAGHTQVFFAPVEWFVPSLAVEHLVVNGGTSHIYRLAPSAQIRVSDNLTLIFSTRDVFTGVSTGRSRTYSVQIAVKTVE